MNQLRSHELDSRLTEVRLAGDLQVVQHSAELLLATAHGITDVNEIAGLHRTIDNSLVSQADALSFITSEVKNQAGQVQIEPLFETLIGMGFANPNNPSYILVADDLVAENTNFVFGMTLKSAGMSVQSVYRYREKIKDPDLLAQVTRFIARHEYGHLLGLDADTIRNQDRREGRLYKGHCANECTMQQVMNVAEAEDLTRKLADKPHAGFCEDCAAYLVSLSDNP